MKQFSLITIFALILSSCTKHQPTPYELHGVRGALRPGADYMIQPGDTLFGIAWRYGLDMEEFARWNGITNPDRILAGTFLRTRPPVGVQKEKVVVPQVTVSGLPGWIWPTKGQILRGFIANQPGGQGLKISGSRGQAIYATNDGEVAYVGSGVFGFGRMIILQHPDKVLSAYGYLDNINVKEKQKISRGEQIATMGIGPKNIPTLHFEMRKQGRSVNPYSFIGTVPRY